MSELGEVREVLDEIVEVIMANPEIILVLVLLAGIYKYGKSKLDERAGEEYNRKDWNADIPETIKYVINDIGFPSNKDLERGDTAHLGDVYKYEISDMPSNMNYFDYIMEDKEDIEIEEDVDFKEVYIFLVAPSSGLNYYLWKLTDIHLGKNSNTKIFVVSKENVDEEYGRFKIKEDVNLKEAYNGIYMEKSTECQNATDQYPIYEARRSMVEGVEDFTTRTIFFKDNTAEKILELREDVDEEMIEKLFKQGKNF